jgi:hypothetical protein
VIKELKWTKKARIAVATLCIVLATASLIILSQMGQVAEAAILEPVESPPELVFNDDFSGDLSQWTNVSGTWAIESSELDGETSGIEGWIYANTDPLSRPFTVEFNVTFLVTPSNGKHGGMMIAHDESNRWATSGYEIDWRDEDVAYRIIKFDCGAVRRVNPFTQPTKINQGQEYHWKVVFGTSTITLYVDGVLIGSITDTTYTSGFHAGLWLFSNGQHAHFDDVKVSIGGTSGAYDVTIKEGVSQIVVTCAWSGSGNIKIANLTSPTTTYYESNMSIYEKTTVSVPEITSIINIKRAVLSIPTTTSSESWDLYLNLNGVTTYQVSVETS